MIDHADIDALFEYAPPVGDLTDDTRAIQKLSKEACAFAHQIVDLVPNPAARAAAIRKLVDTVAEANRGLARPRMHSVCR